MTFMNQMWSLEFVEVPIEAITRQPTATSAAEDATTESGLVCATPASATETLEDDNFPCTLESAGLEDSFKFADSLAAKMVEFGSSVDSDAGENSLKSWVERDIRSNCDSQWRRPPLQQGREMTQSPLYRHPDGSGETFSLDEELCYDSLATEGGERDLVEAGLDAAKLVTPSVEIDRSLSYVEPGGSRFGGTAEQTGDVSPLKDFCYITENDVKEAQAGLGTNSGHPKRRLRSGFRWQKQLVFRSKLTMHTAFERKDNKDPAAITALGISK